MCKFALPERADGGISHLFHHPCAIALVREHSRNAEEAHILTLKKGGKGRIQKVFEPRSPRVAPEMLESADQTRSVKKIAFLRHRMNEIQSYRELGIRRVKIYNMVSAPRGNALKDFLCQISMRVDEADSASCFDVLENQIAKEGALSRSGFSDGVKVLAPSGAGNAKWLDATPDASISDVCAFIFHSKSKPCSDATYVVFDEPRG